MKIKLDGEEINIVGVIDKRNNNLSCREGDSDFENSFGPNPSLFTNHNIGYKGENIVKGTANIGSWISYFDNSPQQFAVELEKEGGNYIIIFLD